MAVAGAGAWVGHGASGSGAWLGLLPWPFGYARLPVFSALCMAIAIRKVSWGVIHIWTEPKNGCLHYDLGHVILMSIGANEC